MKGGFATQRRADRFDALLSGDATEAEGRDADLVTLVSAMRSLPPVEARPEFVASLRERLVTEAAAMPAPGLDRATVERLSLHQPTVRRERRLATALGGLAVVSATTSMAVASQGALPGDTLYPVKRVIENAQSNFQTDESDKARSLLEHARQRLAEAQELSADGSDGSEIAEALDSFSGQINEAASLAISDYRETGESETVTELRTFIASALADLDAMSDEVPDEARASLVGAVNTLHTIDSAATQACASCGGPAALPDPMLVADLEGLLSAEPEALQSLARAAEDIAADQPEVEVPDDGGSAAPEPEAPATSSAPDPDLPAESAAPNDPTTVLPEATTSTTKDPVRTLLGDVKNDLEDLNKKAEEEDWTLLDNGLTDGLTEGLGLSSSTD